MEKPSHSVPQDKSQLMPWILKIAPDFKPRWQKHLERWDGQPAGIYNDIAEFAHYVVDCYDTGETSCYSAFFDLVERLIATGSKEMQDLAVVGFLEDIQTIASWRPHKGKAFVRWLGPKSQVAWAQLDELWANHGSLANIIRAERHLDR